MLNARSQVGECGDDKSVRRYVSTLERIYVFEVLKQWAMKQIDVWSSHIIGAWSIVAAGQI